MIKALSRVLKCALMNGASLPGITIHLGVKASNSAAIKLYEKFGFVKIGVRKDYFNVNGTFDDLILMDLYLSK